MTEHDILIKNLKTLLEGKGAHAPLDKALADIPKRDRAIIPDGLPYSTWQLAEHIRIAQWDMLEFCRNPNHVSPKWPEGYWPKENYPSDKDWDTMIDDLEKDRDNFIKLIQTENLFAVIPHGTGQTILQEALQLADHTAYHTAEIIVVRRLLKNWE